jgi:quercetin dioxygenase-like cupin family protein
MSFFADDGGRPQRPGAWQEDAGAPRVPLAPGIVSRPVIGAGVMLTYVEWEPGAAAPVHAHVEEQLLLVVEGEIAFTLGEQQRRIGPGDAVVIPPWVRHGGRSLGAACLTVEAFSPPRAALLALLDQAPSPPG